MLNILQRYTAGSVIRSLIFTWVVLNAVVVALMFGDKWDDLLQNNASTKQAITYFVCVLPQTTLIVFPAVCLMGTLFGMLNLSRQNELAAMFAAGASLRWLVFPTLILSVVLAFTTFFWNEYVAAPLAREGEQLMVTQIQKKKGIFKDYGLMYGSKNRFIRYGNFDRENEVLTDFMLHEMAPDGRGHKRFIRADMASWDPTHRNPETGKEGAWVLFAVTPENPNFIIEVEDDWRTKIHEITPENNVLYLEEAPSDFGVDERHPIQMGYRELKRKIMSLERAGGSVLSLYPELQFKLAFPFSAIALIFIGIAVGASSFLTGREGAARFTYPLALCLAVMGAYYGTMFVFLALGTSGIINQYISAWTPNILFTLLGGWMLYRT